MDHPVILFDGVCKFCNAGVNFVIDRDARKRLRFAPLQSEVGRDLVCRCGLQDKYLETIVLVEGGRCYTRSTAALRITRFLRFPWPLLSVFVFLPAALRDAAYSLLARNRYRWFGKLDSCRLPTPELRERFLA